MALFGSQAQRLGMRPGLLNFAEEKEKKRAPGFWAGGDDFTTRDGIAGLLAVVGDAFSRQAGGEGGATDMLGGQRLSAIEMARKQQMEAEQRRALMEAAQRQGVSQDDVILQQGGIKRPESTPAPMERDLGIWNSWTPEQRQSFEALSNARNPWRVTGPDGRPYQMPTNPPSISDDDWNSGQPIGGPTPRASGGFPRRYRR